MYHYQETVSHSLIIRRKRLDLDLSTQGTEKPTTTRNLPNLRDTSSLLTVNSLPFPHKSANQASYSFLQLLTAFYSFLQLLTASYSFSQLLTASYSLNPLLNVMPVSLMMAILYETGKIVCRLKLDHNFLRSQTWTFYDTRYKISFLPRCHSQCF